MSQETSKMEVVRESSSQQNSTSHSSGQKRIGLTGVLPRRGGRKKTLSLNPEEREALENLIEEVIIDGGMGDSESASSDEEDNSRDGASKDKSDASNVGASENNDPKTASSFKVSKKFYPGQLKVALKHMTDLPPRFSRKLKRAEKYLEMTVTQKKTSLSTSIKEEDEEEILNFNLSPNQTYSIQDPKAISPKQFQNDKVRVQKEKTQKDLKKTIRSLLTDLDQYVDEKERVSISMDLPGAVSCADLERETLGYSIKSPGSNAMPLSSPGVEPLNSKAEITGVSIPLIDSSKTEIQNCSIPSTKLTSHSVNQPLTPKNLSSSLPPPVYNTPPGPSTSKISGNENIKQPVLIDKAVLPQQFSSMTPTSYIDGSSIIMPVQPLIPQMPQIDFSVPPPSTFQFSQQYGISSPQDSYISGKVQYQTQYGYVELPAAGSAPTHTGINFVDTAPIIFQQFNTLPIVSQHQQVPPLPYAGNPGYFLGRFNCQAQPLNYIPQFQTSSSSSLIGADSVYKTSVDRNSQNIVPSKHGSNNPSVGNFRAPFRSKSNSNNQSSKVDLMASKIRPRNFQNYNRHDPMKQTRDVTSLGNFSTPTNSKTNQSNSILHLPATVVDETTNVVTKINQNPLPSTISSPIDPTRPPSTNNRRISNCSNDSGVKTNSSTSEDTISEDCATTGQSFRSKDDSITTVNEFLDPDIDLGSTGNEADDGEGLDVTLGMSFMKKLNEMFLHSESVEDHSTSRPVFLSSRVLKEIFRSIASSPSSSSPS